MWNFGWITIAPNMLLTIVPRSPCCHQLGLEHRQKNSDWLNTRNRKLEIYKKTNTKPNFGWITIAPPTQLGATKPRRASNIKHRHKNSHRSNIGTRKSNIGTRNRKSNKKLPNFDWITIAPPTQVEATKPRRHEGRRRRIARRTNHTMVGSEQRRSKKLGLHWDMGPNNVYCIPLQTHLINGCSARRRAGCEGVQIN